ncbi:MAG: DUF6293 family protein [Salinigranum sp.]
MDATAPRIGERRVHVALLGHERDRIVEPLRRHRADVAYLLADAPGRTADAGSVDFGADWSDEAVSPVDWDDRPDYHRSVRREIDDFADVRGLPVRLDDVYDVMGVTTTVAARHGAGSEGGDRLFVNVSTGPPVAVVGAAIACMAVGARPYAVEPAERLHDVDRTPLTRGVADVVDLPIYPIDAPTEDQVAVLGRLHERAAANRTTDKWNLIEWAEAAELAFLADVGDSRTARYRALESRVLAPLLDRGYVELESVGRSDNVSLTDTGRKVYFAFEHELHGD